MKQETLDAMRAWADGETVEESLSSGRWVEIGGPDKVRSAVFEDYRVYRIKPRTIRIGKYDVPAPLPVDCGTFDANTTYYSPDIESMDGTFTTEEQFWCWDRIDVLRLERGLVHLTREAAELHARALISLTEVKP